MGFKLIVKTRVVVIQMSQQKFTLLVSMGVREKELFTSNKTIICSRFHSIIKFPVHVLIIEEVE